MGDRGLPLHHWMLLHHDGGGGDDDDDDDNVNDDGDDDDEMDEEDDQWHDQWKCMRYDQWNVRGIDIFIEIHLIYYMFNLLMYISWLILFHCAEF